MCNEIKLTEDDFTTVNVNGLPDLIITEEQLKQILSNQEKAEKWDDRESWTRHHLRKITQQKNEIKQLKEEREETHKINLIILEDRNNLKQRIGELLNE